MIKIVLAFGLLLLFLLFASYRPKRKRNKSRSIDVSKYSDKILVELEDCEIISGAIGQKDDSYINVMNPEGSLYSALSKPNDTNNSTYIRYLYGNFKFTAGPFDISSFGVKAACLNQKTTYLYFNKADYSDYYFDVSFIQTW